MDEVEKTKAAHQAVQLADHILSYCDKQDIDANVAQAGLGNAWFRLCEAMGITKPTFIAMLRGFEEEYQKPQEKL